MGREKPEREEKEEEERSGTRVGVGLNAASSAPVTLAPSPLAGHESCPRALRARRQSDWHEWRRAKGPFPEFFPPRVYL